MPKTLGIWEWGCPKRGDAQNAVTADDRTGSVGDLCSRLLYQSIAIDELFLCGYRLIDTNRYQLSSFIDWFSDHRFPSYRLETPGIFDKKVPLSYTS